MERHVSSNATPDRATTIRATMLTRLVLLPCAVVLLLTNWMVLAKNNRLEAALRRQAKSLAPQAGTRVSQLTGLTTTDPSVVEPEIRAALGRALRDA